MMIFHKPNVLDTYIDLDGFRKRRRNNAILLQMPVILTNSLSFIT